MSSLVQPRVSNYILTKVQNIGIPTPGKGVYLYSDESAKLWHPYSRQRRLFIFWRKYRTMASLLQPKESIYIWRKCRTLASLLQPKESIYILTKVQNFGIPTPCSQRSLFIFWRKCRTLTSLLQPKVSIYILTSQVMLTHFLSFICGKKMFWKW